MSLSGRTRKPRQRFSVSALEKFPGFGGENSHTSDFASCIGSHFSRADAQILLISVSNPVIRFLFSCIRHYDYKYQ